MAEEASLDTNEIQDDVDFPIITEKDVDKPHPPRQLENTLDFPIGLDETQPLTEEVLEKIEEPQIENDDFKPEELKEEFEEENPESIEILEEKTSEELSEKVVAKKKVKEKKPFILNSPLVQKILGLLKNPLILVTTILGLLVFALMIVLMLDFSQKQYQERLIGYVKINHRAPQWHKGDLPPEAQESLEIYRKQREKEMEKYRILKEDPREDLPILGEVDAPPLTNQKMLEILKTQKVGKVMPDGVEKSENMNLSGYDLSKLNYKYFRSFLAADLRYCIFNGIKEEGLDFRGASLDYGQFVDAYIPKTSFVRVYLSYGNFYNAVLDGSSFIGVSAQKVQFSSASLVDCNFTDVIFRDSDFSDSRMDYFIAKRGFFDGSNFSNSSLADANFRNASLEGVSFVNADLTNADFSYANLKGANFAGANLTNVKFDDADVAQASFKDVQNVTYEQLTKTKFLLGARNLPEGLVPAKYSWRERFQPPHVKKKR